MAFDFGQYIKSGFQNLSKDPAQLKEAAQNIIQNENVFGALGNSAPVEWAKEALRHLSSSEQTPQELSLDLSVPYQKGLYEQTKQRGIDEAYRWLSGAAQSHIASSALNRFQKSRSDLLSQITNEASNIANITDFGANASAAEITQGKALAAEKQAKLNQYLNTAKTLGIDTSEAMKAFQKSGSTFVPTSDLASSAAAGAVPGGPPASATQPQASSSVSNSQTPYSIPFKEGLKPGQIQSIKNLVTYKSDPSKWTTTDKKNWDYATNGAAVPSSASATQPATTPAVQTPATPSITTSIPTGVGSGPINTSVPTQSSSGSSPAVSQGTPGIVTPSIGGNYTSSPSVGLNPPAQPAMTETATPSVSNVTPSVGGNYSLSPSVGINPSAQTPATGATSTPTPATTTPSTATPLVVPFKSGLTPEQQNGINALVSGGSAFNETDAKNFAYATGSSDYQKFIGKNGNDSLSLLNTASAPAPSTTTTVPTVNQPPEPLTPTGTPASVPFRAGLSPEQQNSINSLVSRGSVFNEVDAKNFAYATGTQDYQQFIGKNGNDSLALLSKAAASPTSSQTSGSGLGEKISNPAALDELTKLGLTENDIIRQGSAIYLKPGVTKETLTARNTNKGSTTPFTAGAAGTPGTESTTSVTDITKNPAGSFDQLMNGITSTSTSESASSTIGSFKSVVDLLNQQSTEQQALNQQISGQIGTLKTDYAKLGTQGTELLAQQNANGVPQITKAISDLNVRIAAKLAAYDQGNLDIMGQTIPQSLLIGQSDALQRQKAVDIGTLTTALAAYKDNLSLANDLAQKTVDLEFAPVKADIEATKTFLQLNQDNLTKAEQKQADKVNLILGERDRLLSEQSTEKKNNLDLMIQIIQAGGDPNNVDMKRSYSDNLKAASSFLASASQDKFTNVSPGSTVIDKNGNVVYQAPSNASQAEPKPAQYQAANFATRMDQATSILDNLESNIAGRTGPVMDAMLALPSWAQSSEIQSYNQAAQNFINAVLRRESGSAIAPSEFDNARKQYLPYAGDSANTLAQKKANRDLVIANLKREAGAALNPGSAGSGGTADSIWSGGDTTGADGIWGFNNAAGQALNSQINIPSSSRLAYVNNNPGNLRFAGQAGATQGEGGFAKFSSPDAGFNALLNQISLDAGRGYTLSGFINKYAPPSENDTGTYLKQISGGLGVNPNTPLSEINRTQLGQLMARKESSSTFA